MSFSGFPDRRAALIETSITFVPHTIAKSASRFFSRPVCPASKFFSVSSGMCRGRILSSANRRVLIIPPHSRVTRLERVRLESRRHFRGDDLLFRVESSRNLRCADSGRVRCPNETNANQRQDNHPASECQKSTNDSPSPHP